MGNLDVSVLVRNSMKKIIISVNTSWNIYNFRGNLIKALISSGYEVVVLAPKDEFSDRLNEFGCQFMELPMHNNGTNPIKDLILLFKYYFLFRILKPDLYLGYTIKPNVYGSIAAHLLNIPVINNIAGLGATFINEGLLTKLVIYLYKFGLKKSYCIFFQNKDDLALFEKLHIVKTDQVDLLPGSGIELPRFTEFSPTEVNNNNKFNFLFIGRMLKDKGVYEYIQAAKIVKQTQLNTEFMLLGQIDEHNKNSICLDEIKLWVSEGIVQYLGRTDDVRHFISQANCVVLPSYREGVPRSLLEAAAMNKPLIATNVTGCRDAVDDGINGYLCQVKNPDDLAQKMLKMLELNDEEIKSMGVAGRKKMIREFDENFVMQKYLTKIKILFNKS